MLKMPKDGKTADEKPECFVIAPIGTEKSEIRARSDQILKHVIRPVAEGCGYKAVRADEIAEPGSITTQVINRTLTVPMVVADLTGNNANVFYELAVRHAIRKPYVQIIQKGERIPFDVAGIRTVEIRERGQPELSDFSVGAHRTCLQTRRDGATNCMLVAEVALF